VKGRITASGDPAPVLDEALKKIPSDCPDAQETFGRVFREGMNRSLADVLVAVTGYEGHVPARGEAVTVEGRGCAWNTRTVALTFGQRIDVVSKDVAYVPELLGQRAPALLFANPTSPPVAMRPTKPGEYILVDSSRLFNAAHVYVLNYATFDVTGLDGQFEIAGIPPGKVKLSALLPITQGLAQRDITIEAGKTLEVDLVIPFDKKAYEAERAAERRAPAARPEAPPAPAPAEAPPKK
jgi:hypothetical protein